MKKKLLKYVVIAVGLSSIASVSGYACVGARPMAMGGAFIAVADDINTTYWNPAGLTFVLDWEGERSELNYTALLNCLKELRYNDFVGFVAPFHLGGLAEGGFGFSYINTRNLLAEEPWGELDWTWAMAMAFPGGRALPRILNGS